MTEPLAKALEYTAKGWLVFPLHSIIDGKCSCGGRRACKPGKHPRTRNGLKDATTDPAKIRSWWKRWPGANIGIRTGAVSGFIVIDVDPRNDGDDSLADLESEHGSLPDTIETLTGGGGRHILFAHPGFHIKNRNCLWPGIDVKGDNGYIVAEPSNHESGHNYAWEVSHHPDEIAMAQAPEWVLAKLRTADGPAEADQATERQRAAETESAEKTERCTITNHSISPSPSDSSVVSADSVISVLSVSHGAAAEIARAIEATVPHARGLRHDCVFTFCRHLRGIRALAGAEVASLRPIVKIWHQRAYPVIGTRPFEATWGDFVTGYPSVKFAKGADQMSIILAEADRAEPPACAQDYESLEIVRLVKLCRALQRHAGDAPFFLSCRAAGDALKIDKTAAWKLLCVLQVDGVIRLEQAATKSKAARYRYIAPDGENTPEIPPDSAFPSSNR